MNRCILYTHVSSVFSYWIIIYISAWWVKLIAECKGVSQRDGAEASTKSASCVNLRVHSRKGWVLSNVSSQELSRPISQLSSYV